MHKDIELVTRAQEILREIARGINPLTKEKIEESNFVNNPKMIRCFMFCAEQLEKAKVLPKNTNPHFIITPQQKANIKIDSETIGFAQFAKLVNEVIDESVSKKASAHTIIQSLKTLGVLGEFINSRNRKETTVLANSADYGFITVHRELNGREFDQVVANKKGQRYLIDNIEMLMGEVD